MHFMIELKLVKAPNKACTRRVGVCAVFEHFSGFGFFSTSQALSTPPHAGNANRWAFPCKIMQYKQLHGGKLIREKHY
jgi:hypothetical protein